MTSGAPETRGDRLEMAVDGCVITSALFSVLTTVAIVLFVLPGPSGQPAELVMAVTSLVLGSAGMVAGPVLAWRLHGRKLNAAAVFGGVVGAAVSGAVAGLVLAVVGPLIGWIVQSLGGSEIAGALALLALVGLAYAAVVLWALIDAVRDLSPSRRLHARLDIARIVSALLIVAFAIGVTWGATRPGEGEMAEAFIFAMAAGIFGAGAAFGAMMGERILKRGLYEPASQDAAAPSPEQAPEKGPETPSAPEA